MCDLTEAVKLPSVHQVGDKVIVEFTVTQVIFDGKCVAYQLETGGGECVVGGYTVRRVLSPLVRKAL